jgi:hydrogenase nickel incorporation protein HypB
METNAREPLAGEPPYGRRRLLAVQQGLLSKNDQQAALNREHFREQGLFVINLMSSPGSGKTALLERTLADLGERLPSAVIVGDLATDNDARRLRRPGVEVVQINTGTMCHLEAAMIARHCGGMALEKCKLLFIENVGNLVCPASYDLGEDLRVVLLSVTEGEDKPLKYPKLFKTADVVVLTKCDLAEAVQFDRAGAVANIQAIAPQARLLELSARTGAGMAKWYEFLEAQVSCERR